MGKKEIVVEETECLLENNFTEDFTIQNTVQEGTENFNFTEDNTIQEIKFNNNNNNYDEVSHIFVIDNCTVSNVHNLILCNSEKQLILNLPHGMSCKYNRITIKNLSKIETVKLCTFKNNIFISTLNDTQHMLGPYGKVEFLICDNYWYCL